MLAQPTAPAAHQLSIGTHHRPAGLRAWHLACDRGAQTIATTEAGVALAVAVVRSALADLLTAHSRIRARRFLLDDFPTSIWAEWLDVAGISIRPEQMAAAVAARTHKTRRRRDDES